MIMTALWNGLFIRPTHPHHLFIFSVSSSAWEQMGLAPPARLLKSSSGKMVTVLGRIFLCFTALAAARGWLLYAAVELSAGEQYNREDGCHHEFCTLCALYLCSIDSMTTSVHGPPGSVACPLCRHAIVKFIKLPGARQIKDLVMVRLSTSLHASGAMVASKSKDSIAKQLSKFVSSYSRSPQHPSSSFPSLSFQWLLRHKFLHQT